MTITIAKAITTTAYLVGMEGTMKTKTTIATTANKIAYLVEMEGTMKRMTTSMTAITTTTAWGWRERLKQ